MNKKKQNAVPYIVLSLCAVLLLVRGFYSFCWSDEPFYFSTAYRFYQGDALFRHEWFPTQLSSVLILPLFRLYMAVNGSTEGILLFFRICYVFYSLAVSLVVYRVLRYGHGAAAALACSLLCLFYAHLNIATLSYYTMSVGFYLPALLLIYHYYQRLRSEGQEYRKYLVFSGVSLALAVLCLPTLAAAYFAVILAAAVLLLACKLSHREDFLEKTRLVTVCLYNFYGILIPAALFLIYLFSKISLQELLTNLPFVLSDEEHATSLVYPFKKFFIGINQAYGYAAYAGYALAAFTLLFGRKLKENARAALSLLNLILFAIYAYCSFGHTGYLFTAVCLFGVSQYFLTVKRDRYLFFLVFVPGLILSMVYSYSSNGYLYILSIGHFISSVAAVLFIRDYALEVRDRAQPLLLSAVVALLLLQTTALRIVNVYRDAPLLELTERIETGPARGLYTTPEHAGQYRMVYGVIREYASSEAGFPSDSPVFFTKLLPWGYLASDLPCGAPTTWRTRFDSARLKPYYELNPEKAPKVIFLMDEEIGSYDTSGDVVADPSPNENETGGFLLDYVTREQYVAIPVECGTIYLSPSLS